MKHNNGFAVHKLTLASHSCNFIVFDSTRQRQIFFPPQVCVYHNSMPNYRRAQMHEVINE